MGRAGVFRARPFARPIYRKEETEGFRPTSTRKPKQNANIMAKLFKIAETKDVPPGQAAAFTIEGQKVALFNVEGT